MRYDFIAIGDVTTDAFIRLKDAEIHCTVNREKCEICLRFGDKVPYENVWVVPAVGNSANAAVAAARLGLKSALVSSIGSDLEGKESLAVFSAENVGTEFVNVNAGKKTNYHYVLWYEDDRTILIKHQDYNYAMPDIDDPAWVYLTSLGESGEKFHDTIADWLMGHRATKLAFQPGTFQMKLGVDRLKAIYELADIFFCNKEEAERILGLGPSDIKLLLKGIHDLGPKIVVITDGPRGAYVYEEENTWVMPIYPDPKPPFERTGAGDAFSSTFVAALAAGLNITDAMRWAPINSMSVVQDVGARAGLLTREKLEGLLKMAPKYYLPKKL
ncbi:MAG: carbohydrate kinase family protein [Candidatus Liptonbacteria bacterium]|nr:carbohydrate kinase family protein [Candidatus Liptonbacteria bacterium]